ncbi:MAG TPA: pantoate--beta-alanine ligase [Thermoanaerobaculia bacterium]|nr:pantoate--beta-alanine ligase [Thermoanaerobaculia bacterium]
MHMTLSVATVTEMLAARDALTGPVGLVPTMGYLHEGHLSLVHRSKLENDHTIVTIFVNPTQFGPNEDFERYPRNETRDLDLLEAAGVDIVFVPTVDEMYPQDFDDWVEVTGPVVDRLEGRRCPGHFRGVTTIVARLFRIIRPDRAYFGQKDAQQLRVIRRMANDLALPVNVIGLPTIREPDGLAMSSRNVYLLPEDRSAALVLSRSLRLAEDLVRQGETKATEIKLRMQDLIETEPRVTLDYISITDEQTLEELDTIDRPALALLAAHLTNTRLIDNTVLIPPGAAIPSHLADLITRP